MHSPSRMLPLIALAALTLAAPEAMAAPGDTTDKKIRVGVDTEVFGFGHINPDDDPDDTDANDGVNLIGFGVGRGLLQEAAYGSGGAFGGAGLPNVGIHVGGVILGGRAVVGGRVAISMGGITTQAEDDNHFFLFSGELIPYFRWLFMDGPIRPYVEGHFGLGGGLVKVTDTDPMIPEGQNSFTTHVLAPSVGAAGGAMFFVGDHISIDLGLGLDYAAPHTRTTFEDEMPPFLENTEWNHASDNIVVNVTAGISGWF